MIRFEVHVTFGSPFYGHVEAAGSASAPTPRMVGKILSSRAGAVELSTANLALYKTDDSTDH